MPYIGQSPYQVAFVTDTFSGNGSTTVFTMSVAPANTASVLVVVSGVVQDPSTYSVSGTTLTFSGAPPSGTGNISARYLGVPASGVTTTAYRTITEFTATAGQTTFTPPSYTVGFINVYRNGVRLGSTDYTATNGTIVVLTLGATSGDLVTVESYYVSSVLNAIPATAGAVNSTYIANGAVGTAQLATGSVAQNNLAANVAGNGPAFSAYQSTNQTISATTWTKITIDTKEFDTNTNFDTSLYRFKPTVAGYYQISGITAFSTVISSLYLQIYKNGTGFKALANSLSTSAGISGSALIYLNGSTDYVELYAYVVAGATTAPGLNNTYFQASLVRSA